MEIRMILLGILAHLLGDFVFQGDFITNKRFPNKLLKEKNDLNTKKIFCSQRNIFLATRTLEKKARIHNQQRRSFLGLLNKEQKIAVNACFCSPNKIMHIIHYTFIGNLVHSIIQGLTLISIIFINNFIGGILEPNKFFTTVNINLKGLNGVCLISGFVLMHLIIDQIKSVVFFKCDNRSKNISFFIVDQLLHLMSFVLLPSLYFRSMNIYTTPLRHFFSNPREFILNERALTILITFVIITAFAGVFIKILIEHLDKNQSKWAYPSNNETDNNCKNNTTEIKNGGYIIGVLERVLILCAILISHPALIGYILTAKSIARLKKLNEDKFAEYFLIGNLLSFTIAIVGSSLIKYLITH